MSDRTCSHETAVVESVRTGKWEDGMRSHLHACAVCTEAARVATWIGSVATHLGRDRAAPDPTYIWMRAEIERRKQAERSRSWRRPGMAELLWLAAGLVVAATVLAVLPELSAIATGVSTWLSTAFAETSLVDRTVIGTVWLGLPLVLVAIYLLVLRPLR
jgi:hypothetical protein